MKVILFVFSNTILTGSLLFPFYYSNESQEAFVDTYFNLFFIIPSIIFVKSWEDTSAIRE